MVRAVGRVRFGLTEAGKVILRGIGFIALAALVIPAFDVLSVLVCVMLVALVIGFFFRPRTLVTGTLPERIIAGQTAHLTYTIKNLGRRPAYHLRLWFRALPEAIEQVGDAEPTWRLGAGETTDVVVAIRPRRRGVYQIRPPVCESSFPFNLFHFGAAHQDEESLVVLPAFSLLELSLPYASRHVNASSVRPAGRMGTSPEYIGSRPYQPGDSRRRIDVRAWARLSAPVTKEYDDDLDNYAALVLDTRAPGAGGRGRRGSGRGSGAAGPGSPCPELEAAVSLCASVAYTIHRDCLIDLLLAGTDLHSFTSLPRTMRVDRVHEILAAVEPSQDCAADEIGALWEDRLSEISEVIFIVRHWNRTYQQLAASAEQAGCHCTVFVVGEGKPSDFGLRIADCGLKEAIDANPQSAIRNPQSTVGPIGDVRFVTPDEVLAGRRDLS